jgi:hypothetical protein
VPPDKSAQWSLKDQELSWALICDVYVRADGSALLVFEDKRGMFYDSQRELLEWQHPRVQDLGQSS